MTGLAAYHHPDGTARVLSRRPLVLTASGSGRLGYTSFWIAPLQALLTREASAGDLFLDAQTDFDFPDSGLLLVSGWRIAYVRDADGRLSLQAPLPESLPRGARLTLAVESDPADPWSFHAAGADTASGQFQIRIRGAGQASYFPASGYLEIPYAGGSDALQFACGFRGSLKDWSGMQAASFLSGEASEWSPGGVAPGTGAVRIRNGQKVVWRFLADSLEEGCLELWFRPEIPATLLSVSSGLHLLEVAAGTAGLSLLVDGVQQAQASAPEFNRWNFFALSWKNGQARPYLNGSWGASFALPAGLFSGLYDLSIESGCGWADEIRLFRRAIPASAVASHWNGGSGCGLDSDLLPAFRMDLMIEAAEGPEAFWRNCNLAWSSGSRQVFLPLEAARVDASAVFRTAVFPESVRYSRDCGFIVGKHRWPSALDPADAMPIEPARWDWDPAAIGLAKFTSGVAMMDDLRPEGIVRREHAIRLRLRRGFFFNGPERHYRPAEGGFRIVRYSSDGSEGLIHLDTPLRPQTPVYARFYRVDLSGAVRIDADFVHRPEFSGAEGVREMVVDRISGLLRLRGRFQPGQELLGRAPDQIDSGGLQIWMDLPVYPVWSVHSVQTEDGAPVPVSGFDRDNGRVRLLLPPESAGKDLLVSYEPALLVTFEPEGSPEAAEVEGLDLNPSASGLSAGYIVLMGRRPAARQIVLFCDKPRLRFDFSPSAQVPMTVFGPVYYGSDFAILMAQAFGSGGAETIPNLTLKFRALPGFQGRLRYEDPADPDASLEAVTNGEGVAWMLYTPPPVYGFYFHPSLASWTGSSLRLPMPADSQVYLPQFYEPSFGWKIKLYFVRNNHPYLGKVGANIAIGEVPWAEFGNIGTSQYRTNGFRELQSNQSGAAIRPVQLYDSAGRPALLGQGQVNPDFSGPVAEIEYDLPDASMDDLGAYFFSLIGLVGVWAEDPQTGVRSNTIYLQLDMAPDIVDQPDVAGYLFLDSPENGRINIHRLGGGPLPRFVIAVPKL